MRCSAGSTSILLTGNDRPIAKIKRADIKELIRLKARTAPISANRLVALISKIFNRALKEELIETSPAIQIDRPGKETERERALSVEEIRTVWGAFDAVGYPFGRWSASAISMKQTGILPPRQI